MAETLMYLVVSTLKTLSLQQKVLSGTIRISVGVRVKLIHSSSEKEGKANQREEKVYLGCH